MPKNPNKNPENNNTIYDNSGNEIPKTRHLLDMISMIESYAVAEKHKAQIPDELFITKNRIEFWTAGIRIILGSGLFTVFMMPLAIAGIENRVPLFGSTNPSLFDQIFAIVYTISLSLMYAILLFSLRKNFVGRLTGLMIKTLYSGASIGLAVKIVFSFVWYHCLYFFVVTPKNVYLAINWLIKWHLLRDMEFAKKMYAWIIEARPDILTSFWFVFVTCILFYGLIWIGYFTKYRNLQKKSNEEDDEQTF